MSGDCAVPGAHEKLLVFHGLLVVQVLLLLLFDH